MIFQFGPRPETAAATTRCVSIRRMKCPPMARQQQRGIDERLVLAREKLRIIRYREEIFGPIDSWES